MSTPLTIRRFKASDTQEIINLFRNTVHSINIRDYTQEQVDVWAPKDIDATRWQETLENNEAFVAEKDSVIVGFADLTHEGYLKHLYIHKDYQGVGIGSALFKQIEDFARKQGLEKITAQFTITAKKFAEKIGFLILKEQTVERKGILLTNFVMEKIL